MTIILTEVVSLSEGKHALVTFFSFAFNGAGTRTPESDSVQQEGSVCKQGQNK